MEWLAHDMGPCLHVSGSGMPFLSCGGWVGNIDYMSLLTFCHVVDAVDTPALTCMSNVNIDH